MSRSTVNPSTVNHGTGNHSTGSRGAAARRAGPSAAGRGLALGLHGASADAPLLAVCWAAAFAAHLGAGPDPARLGLLAAGVWLAWSADRLLDGLRLERGTAGTPRHEFAIRWRAPLSAAWVAVLASAACLAPAVLSAVELRSSLLLAACGAGYVLCCQQWPDPLRRRPPREAVVGALLALAVVQFSGGLGPGAGPAAFGLALLCALDCLAIAAWERAIDAGRGERSLALERPRLARNVGRLALGLAGVCLALGICSATEVWPGAGSAALWFALALGAAWLWVLDGRAALAELRPVLADLGLAAAGLAAVLGAPA